MKSKKALTNKLVEQKSWIKRILTDELFWGVFLTIVAIIVLDFYFTSTSYICSKNPDKCVCEEEIAFCKQKGSHLSKAYSENYELECCDKKGLCYQPTDFKCSKFHKKTQAEQDIDSCNSNPREDDLCKCEEKTKSKEPLHLNIILYPEETLTILDGIIDLDILEDYKFDDIYDYEIMELSGGEIYYPYNTSTNLDYMLWGKRWNQCAKTEEVWIPTKWDGDKIIEMRKESREDSSECTTIQYQITFYDTSEPKCIKSHPKFDYEKHPENYVAEIKCIQYNKIQVLTNSTELACQPSLNMSDNERQEWHIKMIIGGACPFPLVNTTFFTSSEIDGNECVQNQTTYRLKNECEKGNPDWVEEKFYEYEGIKFKYCQTKVIENEEYYSTLILNSSECNSILKTICREKEVN